MNLLRLTGAQTFFELHAGPPETVPCLAYLRHLGEIVDNFVCTFLSMRSIATFRDLDLELAAVLNSFRVPAFNEQFINNPAVGNNPEEIELSDDEGQGAGNTFAEFGVGQLSQHPAVMAAFSSCDTGRRALWGWEVVAHLVDFVRKKQVPGHPAEVSKVEFEHYIAHQHAVDHVSQLGVRCSPQGLGDALQMARHVCAKEREFYARQTRRYLDELALQEKYAEDEGRCKESTCRKPVLPTPKAASIPVLKAPSRPLVAELLQRIEEHGECTHYRPSYSKLKHLARQLFPAQKQHYELLLEAAVEYAMLHLGGDRARHSCNKLCW